MVRLVVISLLRQDEYLWKPQYKDSLKTTTRLDHLQAVFLVEILSHFKAKRAPLSLSEVFRAVYNQVHCLHATSETTADVDC